MVYRTKTTMVHCTVPYRTKTVPYQNLQTYLPHPTYDYPSPPIHKIQNSDLI